MGMMVSDKLEKAKYSVVPFRKELSWQNSSK